MSYILIANGVENWPPSLFRENVCKHLPCPTWGKCWFCKTSHGIVHVYNIFREMRFYLLSLNLNLNADEGTRANWKLNRWFIITFTLDLVWYAFLTESHFVKNSRWKGYIKTKRAVVCKSQLFSFSFTRHRKEDLKPSFCVCLI
jgi:hypothetical protein